MPHQKRGRVKSDNGCLTSYVTCLLTILILSYAAHKEIWRKCLAGQIHKLGNSLDLFHMMLYGAGCHKLCIGALLMIGRSERAQERGRRMRGCKDMKGEMMKGAGCSRAFFFVMECLLGYKLPFNL